MRLIWQPDIVHAFRGCTERCAADPPEGFIEENFNKENESVVDFYNRVEPFSDKGKEQAYQHFLLASLSDTSLVGTYSSW